MFAKTRQAAKELAQQVTTDFPPSLQELSGRKAIDMFQRASAQLRQRAQALQKEERMGLVRRIVFARSLQKELVRLGYHGTLIRNLMSETLMALTLGNR